jgi:hypothetical protein
VVKQFGAHLTGMFSVFVTDRRSFYVMAGSVEYCSSQEKLHIERRAALERLFHAELGRAKVPGDWAATDEGANLAVPRRGRSADHRESGPYRRPRGLRRRSLPGKSRHVIDPCSAIPRFACYPTLNHAGISYRDCR